MLQYQFNQTNQLQPCSSVKGRTPGRPIQPKLKKLKKCSQRSTRRNLKNEFEKFLIPAFASKVARSYAEKSGYNYASPRNKKASKILPDNLAEFIIENESSHPVISDEDYMKCMEILTKTNNRKYQIMQICQLLGIEKETIRKERRIRSKTIQMRNKAAKPRRKRTVLLKQEDESTSASEPLFSPDVLNSSITVTEDQCQLKLTEDFAAHDCMFKTVDLSAVDMDFTGDELISNKPNRVSVQVYTPTFLQVVSEALAVSVAEYACLFLQF